ncbi:protein-serine O-palmitoleoyltransferase porcupine-like isoform X2 [Gigantopelta aegis]|nr:protein-serine O-palmitoleoyltransferase porcupine-like isoform X2 [Gigantopelta aegis]
MELDPDLMYDDYDDDLMQYLDGDDYNPDLEDLLAAYHHGYDLPQHYERVSVVQLYQDCIVPTLTQAVQNIVSLFIMCLVFRLVCVFGSVASPQTGLPPWFLHVSSAMFGIMVLHNFFKISLLYLVACCGLTYILLTALSVRWRHLSGIVIAASITVFIIVCELIVVHNTTWHMIRGAQMILSMKIISLAFDFGSGAVMDLPNIFEYLGYCLNVGTVIFGPWISYKEYIGLLQPNRLYFSLGWMLKLIRSSVSSLLCLIVSTCVVQWLILGDTYKWLRAYGDAQSFRFSHYFVSFLSESTAVLSGIGIKDDNGNISWDLKVSRPHHIEIPRSLVEVVTNWNLPMHYWLKTYVFKSARPLGTFVAILFTYAFSALLHGLNFQLAAVLFSLGFYSYVEYVLRNKLSTTFSACIQAKHCPGDCEHTYHYWHPAVLIVNVCFGMLTVFHLAYLGLMFDSSSQQEQGYTMLHTLDKWAKLDYASHWVVLGTFIFHLLI